MRGRRPAGHFCPCFVLVVLGPAGASSMRPPFQEGFGADGAARACGASNGQQACWGRALAGRRGAGSAGSCGTWRRAGARGRAAWRGVAQRGPAAVWMLAQSGGGAGQGGQRGEKGANDSSLPCPAPCRPCVRRWRGGAQAVGSAAPAVAGREGQTPVKWLGATLCAARSTAQVAGQTGIAEQRGARGGSGSFREICVPPRRNAEAALRAVAVRCCDLLRVCRAEYPSSPSHPAIHGFGEWRPRS